MSILESVEGRFEVVSENNKIGIVDFAHTPDAIKKVLLSLREYVSEKNKLITIVGCGGGRDKLKRFKIDILINNAGALFFSRKESVDKIEKTFALNHLSYFILTNLLLKYKVIKKGGRIVNVASGAHRGVKLDLNNLEMIRNYKGWISYKKSKLCNILFTKKLSELIEKNKITVNCLHPGFVKTQFGKINSGLASLAIKFLMNFFAISVKEGAETIVFLATDKSIKNITGKYFYKSKIKESSIFAQSQKDADLLWEKSISIVKNKGLTLV